ncbi:MAG: DUF6438 domain-containing protein [Saprospiraceae bacterium]
MRTFIRFTVLLAVILPTLQSCGTLKKMPPLPEEPIYQDETLELDELNISLFEPDIKDTIALVYLLASIEKTYCYKDCPEFRVDFFSDGRLVYEGFHGKAMKGTHIAQIDSTTIQRIKQTAEKSDFFRLKPYYPDYGEIIDELPVTISSVDFIFKNNRVTNAHHSPVALHHFERLLIDIIDKQDWKKN